MKVDIYGEVMPDRIKTNSDEDSIQIQYPEQLIITIASADQPELSTIITLIRKHILESKKQGVQPNIVLNFCIGYFDGIDTTRSDLYIQKFIALSEYIIGIRAADPSILVTLVVRGIFLKSMYPLLYIDIPVKISEHTYFELYNGAKVSSYTNQVEQFLQSLGYVLTEPLLLNDSNTKLIKK